MHLNKESYTQLLIKRIRDQEHRLDTLKEEIDSLKQETNELKKQQLEQLRNAYADGFYDGVLDGSTLDMETDLHISSYALEESEVQSAKYLLEGTMEKLTKEQAIVITGYTGTLCCEFSDLHEEVEKRLGRPVFTHEFPPLKNEIADAFREDFLSLCPGSGD